ncbi:MAG: hypothetical protein KIH62_003230 [Candidatus Kerfeldbacteria bacterium]|nr:hypothetical protein [Candidatus Kerfeldbacteria bacterium]
MTIRPGSSLERHQVPLRRQTPPSEKPRYTVEIIDDPDEDADTEDVVGSHQDQAAARAQETQERIHRAHARLSIQLASPIELPHIKPSDALSQEILAEGLEAILNDYRADNRAPHIKYPELAPRVAEFLATFQ